MIKRKYRDEDPDATDDQRPRYPVIDSQVLRGLLKQVPRDCRLVANAAGNLAIQGPPGDLSNRPGKTGFWYCGWIDLYEQRVVWIDALDGSKGRRKEIDFTDDAVRMNYPFGIREIGPDGELRFAEVQPERVVMYEESPQEIDGPVLTIEAVGAASGT